MNVEDKNHGRRDGGGTPGPSRSITRNRRRGTISQRGIAIVAIVVAIAVAGTAIALYLPRAPTQFVQIDGSSTVYPITSAWALEFNVPNQRQVVVGFSGTGGGFQKFCRGETDLSDASRPIRQSERNVCAANNITGIVEYRIAYDGLSVVVHKDNTWANALTVKQLCRIWTQNTSAGACGGAGPRVATWNELNASWPSRAIKLFGPGTASGTFDYFVEVILTPTRDRITSDFIGSENDNVVVQGIANDVHALGYFGYAYVVENLDKIRPVAIDDEKGTDGPVLPSDQTIRGGIYTPLSRPLFIYASEQSLSRQVVKDFLRFGFSARGVELVSGTGYVGLTTQEVASEVAKIPA